MAEVGSGLESARRIQRALSRPNLLMGADRELVLLTGACDGDPDFRCSDVVCGPVRRRRSG